VERSTAAVAIEFRFQRPPGRAPCGAPCRRVRSLARRRVLSAPVEN